MERFTSYLLAVVAGGRAARRAASAHHAPWEVIHAEIGATLEICPTSVMYAGMESVRWQLPVHLRHESRSKTEQGTYCLQVFHWESVDTGTYKFEGLEVVDSWTSRHEFFVVPMIQHRVWLFPGERAVRFLPKKQLPKIANVIWYRSDHKIAECRVSDDDIYVCTCDEAFKERTVLNATSGELTLREIEFSDYDASFTLRVNDQSRKWTEQFTILTVPVLKVAIEVGETLHLDPEFTPHYKRGNIIEIATVTWTHGNETIENTDATVIDSDHGELTIANWTPPRHTNLFTVKLYDDHGGEITKQFRVETIVRVKVEVDTVLCLDPEFSGEIDNITWKYGPNLAVEHTNGVDVVYHDAFKGTSSITTTNGKLMVNDWKPGDIFTVEINNDFVKTIVVEGVLRVEIGTTLYLDPKFSGKINSIAWNQGDKSAVESYDGVRLAYYGAHKHTSKMILATGKLMVSDWKPFDDPIFTVDINAGGFAAAFNVENTIRVELNGDLRINLGFVGEIEQMVWMLNGTQFFEFDQDNGAIFRNIGCSVDNFWDTSSTKLTATSWNCDGKLNVVINHDFETTISVVTNVVYIAIGGQKVSDPKHHREIEDHIVWRENGDIVVADSKWDNVTVSIIDGKLGFSNSDVSVNGLINVEINGKTMPQSFVAVGVRKLDTYDGLQMTFGENVCANLLTTRKCEFICGEDVEGAEPVTYFWKKKGENIWVPGTKHMDAEYFWNNFALDGCSLRNPVSVRNLSIYG